MKYTIILALALAVSGCQTQGGTGGEVTASDAGQRRGTIRTPSGIVYTGQLKDGQPHGQGTAKTRDGTRYTGQWRNGIQHGQGTWVLGNTGFTYKGQVRNGEMTGVGICTFKGKSYACQCNRGLCKPTSS